MSRCPTMTTGACKGQEKYLVDHTFHWVIWTAYRENWDHDHCQFCAAEVSDRPVDEHTEYNAAWATEGYGHWICPTCFDDFRDRFGLVVEGSPPAP